MKKNWNDLFIYLYTEICGRGSEYENEGVAESVKEEKKRKQSEAIADDLFNNAKVFFYLCA